MTLQRRIDRLSGREYDLVVVGGGIFGACAAWDAALRGLKVVLLEKEDFSHATSANHFKMIHGGIRYLQHGDLLRVRESSHERSALLRIAPHLSQPLPIVIPTYGHGLKGKAFLGTGMALYDLLTFDRNQGLQPTRRIPLTRFVSRNTILEWFPNLMKAGLTGGAVFYDGQMYNPPRIALAFIRSAANRGALPINYAQVDGFLRDGNRVHGVWARDMLSGDRFEVRSKMVLNTAGPWAHRLLASALGVHLQPRPTFSRDLAFVVKKQFPGPYALALSSKTKDADSILDRGGRHLFAVPWREHTLIGVWHKIFEGPSEEITVSPEELREYKSEVDAAYPGLCDASTKIQMVNTGLTLFGDENSQGEHKLSFGKRSQIIDHHQDHQIEGLMTLIGVRATTARGMATKAMDRIATRLGLTPSVAPTADTPIFGGDIEDLQRLHTQALDARDDGVTADQMTALVRNYGSAHTSVLEYVAQDPNLRGAFTNSTVLRAEVVHAVRREMAQKLSDVVFRRTDLGTGACPHPQALDECARIMAQEMQWDDDRRQREIQEVLQRFPSI